jgi:two-component system LytT family response regulator
MIRALIVDDEKRARETIREVIKLYCPEITSVSEADSVPTAVEAIHAENPDLLFLDIRLNDGSGFDVLKHLHDKKPGIIFITAYEEYAIQAFKVSALDYLLKPIDPDDFSAAVKRALQKINEGKFAERMDVFMKNMENASQGLKKMTLKTSDSIHVINIADIVCCEADRNYTDFHLITGEKITVSRSLGEYEDMLPVDSFLRVHQSYLVNAAYIKRYDKTDGGFLITVNGKTIPVSTRKKDQVIQFLSKL